MLEHLLPSPRIEVMFTRVCVFVCQQRHVKTTAWIFMKISPEMYLCIFVSAADRKRVDAFLRRSKRCGFCPTDLLTFGDLLGQADTRLFNKIVANDQHVLHQLLPPQTTASQNYSLRERPHQFQLPERSGRLSDSNFVNRMLYKDIH